MSRVTISQVSGELIVADNGQSNSMALFGSPLSANKLIFTNTNSSFSLSGSFVSARVSYNPPSPLKMEYFRVNKDIHETVSISKISTTHVGIASLEESK